MIIDTASITQGGIYYQTATSTSYTPGTKGEITYKMDTNSSWQTHAYPVTDELVLQNLVAGEPFSVNALSTCTAGPFELSDIAYEFISHEDGDVPDWISVNSGSSKFEGTAVKIYYDTDYSFKLNSTWTKVTPGNTEQLIKVKVIPSTEVTPTSVAATEAATTSAAASSAFSVIVALLNGASPAALYTIIHMIRMILLMMLIDPYIPTSMREYGKSQSFALINFNIFPSIHVPYVNIPPNYLFIVQENPTLDSLGVESGSTFFNHYGFFLFMIFLCILHFCLKILFICDTAEAEAKHYLDIWMNRIRKKLVNFIQYTLYLRLIIETQESLMLSATSEIYKFNVKTLPNLISFLFAVLVFAFVIALPIVAYYYYKKNKIYDPKRKFLLMEFFVGLRNNRYARLYMTLLLTRRVCFISFIIFLNWLPREVTYPYVMSKNF